jgi:hypothetical protein
MTDFNADPQTLLTVKHSTSQGLPAERRPVWPDSGRSAGKHLAHDDFIDVSF